MFDVAKVRKDFPILEEQVYGKRLVYRDNGAIKKSEREDLEAKLGLVLFWMFWR